MTRVLIEMALEKNTKLNANDIDSHLGLCFNDFTEQ